MPCQTIYESSVPLSSYVTAIRHRYKRSMYIDRYVHKKCTNMYMSCMYAYSVYMYILVHCVPPTSNLLFMCARTQFGSQVFILQGRGSEPSTMDTTTIQASLNTNNTHVITFTNALDIATHFKVALKDTQSSEHFCLLMKRTRGILLQPGVSLDMPVMFAPETMHTHKTTITVSCSITEEKGENGGGNQLNLE